MTSSKTSSAPTASHAARRPSRKPGAGATRPMFAATGSTMTQATVLVELGHRVVGDDDRVGHRAGGHAGRARQAERGDAAAAAGQQRVGVAVVAAVELHDPVAPGDARGRGGPRSSPPRSPTRRAGPARTPGTRAQIASASSTSPGSAPRRWCRRRPPSAIASSTAGWAWPRSDAPRRTARSRGSGCPRRR